MNFAAFRLWREECLRTMLDVLDCGETNLYSSLASLQPSLEPTEMQQKVHRCDLARAWLQRYGFDIQHSRRALVSRGVRHALQLIFRRLAADGASLWLPQDVYPVYQALAEAAGIEPKSFTTLPTPSFPRAHGIDGAEFLLVANPLKPLGRFLSGQDCDALVAWLDASPNRRLLIDCVYDLGAPFHPTTMKLQQTGRAILLHSATKGWLKPETFGVALLAEDWPEMEADFRADPPSAEQLQFAQHFLSAKADYPAQVADVLKARAGKLSERLPPAIRDSILVASADRSSGCYLFPVPFDAEQLLNEHRVLAIPASAFGSQDWNGSVLTSLSSAFATRDQGRN